MMIPYPSSDPTPIPIVADPAETKSTIIGGVAAGALGVVSIAAIFQYMKMKPKSKSNPKSNSERHDGRADDRIVQQMDELLDERVNEHVIHPSVGPPVLLQPPIPSSSQIPMSESITYLCVNTTDLLEITQLLTAFKKRFHIVQTL